MIQIDDHRFHPQLNAFEYAIEAFEKTLEPSSELQLKEKMREESSYGDEIWKRFNDAIDDLLNHTTSEHKQIGKNIHKIVSSYDDPSSLSGLKKYSLTTEIIGNLEKKVSAGHMNHVDIYDIVAELKRSCWAYKQYLDAYNLELTGKRLTRESLEARKKAETAYYTVIEFLNAMFIYKGDEEYTEIIDKINEIIDLAKTSPIVLDIHKEETDKEENSKDTPQEQEAFSA